MKRFKELPENAALIAWAGGWTDARLAGESRSFESLLEEFPFPEIPAGSALGDFIFSNKLDDHSRFILLYLLTATCNLSLLFRFSTGKPDYKALRLVDDTLQASGYTFAWLIAGDDGVAGVSVMEKMLSPLHVFNKKSILHISASVTPGARPMSGVVEFVPGVLEMFLTNVFQPPRFGENFPARLLTTNEEFDDMIHSEKLLEKMRIVISQPMYEAEMRNRFGMTRQMPLGFRVLMTGPPGTGKSMAAAIMGKCMQRDVYQVILSQVMNKYVGETEKNLERLFNMAEGKDWILFFDEADALFGNRKEDDGEEAGSAYRNNTINYLLQRIEKYNGIVFCATNLDNNMDVAFKRRFQEHLVFSLPAEPLRERIWRQYLPDYPHDRAMNVPELAKYLLPPSAIANVCNRVMMYALHYRHESIRMSELEQEIKQEQFRLGIQQ